jgi:hypothetical protein
VVVLVVRGVSVILQLELSCRTALLVRYGLSFMLLAS